MSLPQESEAIFMSAADLDAKLHELTALEILGWFKSEDSLSPGQMQCVLRFLKDNDITALPIPESSLERIKDKVNLPFPRIVDARTKTETPRSDD